MTFFTILALWKFFIFYFKLSSVCGLCWFSIGNEFSLKIEKNVSSKDILVRWCDVLQWRFSITKNSFCFSLRSWDVLSFGYFLLFLPHLTYPLQISSIIETSFIFSLFERCIFCCLSWRGSAKRIFCDFLLLSLVWVFIQSIHTLLIDIWC